MSDNPDDDRNRVFQFVFQSEEQGFIRHLLYCWITRHSPMSANPYGEHVRMSVYMLRLKRALMKASDVELAKYDIDPSTRDTQPGWSTKLGPVDFEVMAIKLDPSRRRKRTCPKCLKSIGYCEEHQSLRWRR